MERDKNKLPELGINQLAELKKESVFYPLASLEKDILDLAGRGVKFYAVIASGLEAMQSGTSNLGKFYTQNDINTYTKLIPNENSYIRSLRNSLKLNEIPSIRGEI